MTLPQAIYRFNAIPIKILMAYFTDLTNIPKIYMEPKKTPNSPSNLEKEEQSWKDHNTWHATILQGHCNQNSMVQHKNGHINKWNRLESTEINPNKAQSLWSTDIQQQGQEHTME